jgi:hypothetical protein
LGFEATGIHGNFNTRNGAQEVKYISRCTTADVLRGLGH